MLFAARFYDKKLLLANPRRSEAAIFSGSSIDSDWNLLLSQFDVDLEFVFISFGAERKAEE